MRQYTDTLLYKLHFKEDILPIIGFLLNPFTLVDSEHLYRLSAWLKYNYRTRNSFLFSTFQDALYALLTAYELKRGDSVLVSALSDIELIYPLLEYNITPVYADVDSRSYTISPTALKRKINKKIKMIIVSHTYGIPSNIEIIRKIAKKNKIILIEDCRDSIGIEWKNKKLGSFSDAALLGFGRNRAISPLPGGIIITNAKRISIILKKIEQKSPYPSYMWVYYHLIYAIVSWLLQNIFFAHERIGRLLYSTTMTIRIYSEPILAYEKRSYVSRQKIKRMPGNLAFIALNQLTKLPRVHKSKSIFYFEVKKKLPRSSYRIPTISTPYFQIPIYTHHIDRVRRFLRRQRFLIPQLYNRVIQYKNRASVYGYTRGSCKTAEDLMRYTLELPSLPWGDRKQLNDILISLKKAA